MAEIYQVSPWEILLEDGPHRSDVAAQKARLEREGQIEPIEVDHIVQTDQYLLNRDGWPYAGAQVAAARELKWPTLLVTY